MALMSREFIYATFLPFSESGQTPILWCIPYQRQYANHLVLLLRGISTACRRYRQRFKVRFVIESLWNSITSPEKRPNSRISLNIFKISFWMAIPFLFSLQTKELRHSPFFFGPNRSPDISSTTSDIPHWSPFWEPSVEHLNWNCSCGDVYSSSWGDFHRRM